MEELISGTGPGQKTTLLTGLWCLCVLVLRNGASHLLNYGTSSLHLPFRLSRTSQCDFYGTADWLRGCKRLLDWPPLPHQASYCDSAPLFWSTKFLEENVDSHVEYYALKGNFVCTDVLNESTNSVNHAEAPLLARALEGSPLGPGRGEKADDWRSGCCQSPMTTVSALIEITLTGAGFCWWEHCVHVEKHWAMLPNAGGIIHSTLVTGLTVEIKIDSLWELGTMPALQSPRLPKPSD